MKYRCEIIHKLRKGDQMAIEPNESREKKPGVLQWLIVIFIPLLFALLLAVIILNLMGVDINKYAKETLNKIPFLEEHVSTDEELLETNQLAHQEETITNLEEEIEVLEYELQTKENEVSELEEEITHLSDQITQLEELQAATTVNTDAYKEMSQSFIEMKAKTAASILENMDHDIAIQLLIALDTESRGNILGEMNPEIAADYTKRIVNE